jgi:hypothetical protein
LKTKGLLFALTLALVLGCKGGATPAPAPEASTSAAARSSATPQSMLDALDRRRPVPLLPMMADHQKRNMREHLEAVQEVVAAAAVGDFEKTALAAKRMGFSESMGRMCEHMGQGAPGFTEQALAFHHAADAIATAAAEHDGARVLTALSSTLQLCTSCHATYKQQLVAALPE